MWLKIYCLLCGYNYRIARQTSERFQKYVRKNFAALIILMVLWYLIGHTFVTNHFDFESLFAPHVVGIGLMVFIVLVERQIMLSDKGSWRLFFRGVIGVLMAIIGAFVIDQVIFQSDIESFKRTDPSFKEKVERREKIKLDNIRSQIDLSRQKKETSSGNYSTTFNTNSYIDQTTKNFIQVRDSNGVSYSIPNKTVSKKIPNTQRTETLNQLKLEINDSDTTIVRLLKEEENIKTNALEEAIENSGFLEDLVFFTKFLWSKGNWPALLFYALIFLFLLSLESLILINKVGYKRTDYDELMDYQKKTIIEQFGK